MQDIILDIRFDLSDEIKVKELFEKTQRLMGDEEYPSISEEILMKEYGETTNYIFECFGNFILSTESESCLDIAVLKSDYHYNDIILFYAGEIAKNNLLSYIARLDDDCDIIEVSKDITSYKEFANFIKKEMKFLKYISNRGLSKEEFNDFESIRKIYFREF